MSATVRWHQSLAWKFFLRTAAAILLIMGVVLAVAYQQAQKGAMRSAGDGLVAAAQVLDRSFEQQGRVLDAGLEVFVQYTDHFSIIEKGIDKGDPVSVGSVRDALLNNLSKLQSELAVVVRPSGHLLSCTTDGHKQDYSDSTLAQLALDPAGAQAAGRKEPFYRGYLEIPDGTYQGLYHAVSRPILTPGGAQVAAMIVGTKLDDRASDELRQLAIAPPRPGFAKAQLAILSKDRVMGGTLPVALRPTMATLLQKDPRFQAAKAAVMKGERSQPLKVELGGETYLALLSPLRGEDGATLEMATLLAVPMAPYTAPFRTLQFWILGVGIAGLLVALLFSLQAARAVTAPLQALTRATAALAEGERPEIPRLDTQDEVGYLTQSFRALLSELKAKEELLSALESLRASGQDARGMSADLGLFPGTHAGLTAVDLEATLALPPGASQALTLTASTPRKQRLTLREGDIFADRYRIDCILGKGGMGIVLKAHDQQLDEEVALKVIRPEHDLSEGFLDQLKQEIKLARRISHRFVLRTHDFGESQGIPFVSMEYLKGVTLKQLLDDRGRLPLSLVLRIGRQVAEGLEAAHGEGVVHRDIKPLNVLFDSKGDAKLMDFGLAAPVATKGTNEEGQVFGTPRYMAPEQVRGERVDPRTDLYALGVMLFELATGEAPYGATGITELLKQHLNAPVPDPRTRLAELPASFASLVQRLMAKRIEDRPVTAGDVAESLKLIAAGGGV